MSKERKSPSDEVLFIRDLPVHLKAQFKAYCAARNMTMKAAVIQFMEKCVSKRATN